MVEVLRKSDPWILRDSSDSARSYHRFANEDPEAGHFGEPSSWETSATFAYLAQRTRAAAQMNLLGHSDVVLTGWEPAKRHTEVLRVFIANALDRSRLELGLALAAKRLAHLQTKVSGIEARAEELNRRVSALEVANEAIPASISPNDWDRIRTVIHETAAAMGWEAQIHIDLLAQRISIRLPQNQEEALIEQSLSFYEELATSLGPLFRAVAFDLDIAETTN